MTNSIDPIDLEALREAQRNLAAATAAPQAALNAIARLITKRYGLVDGDEIGPNGEILRKAPEPAA